MSPSLFKYEVIHYENIRQHSWASRWESDIFAAMATYVISSLRPKKGLKFMADFGGKIGPKAARAKVVWMQQSPNVFCLSLENISWPHKLGGCAPQTLFSFSLYKDELLYSHLNVGRWNILDISDPDILSFIYNISTPITMPSWAEYIPCGRDRSTLKVDYYVNLLQ